MGGNVNQNWNRAAVSGIRFKDAGIISPMAVKLFCETEQEQMIKDTLPSAEALFVDQLLIKRK